MEHAEPARRHRATVIAVGSGKGGVGKSLLACNLGVALARRGHQVVVADLDTGGANQHLLFGITRPAATLDDFLARRAASLEEVALPVPAQPGLRLVAGAGDTLGAANLPYARKLRLVRNLARLPARVIVVDVGAGVGFNALDFFLTGDVLLAVSTPDPASVLDVYRFLKLAAVRRVLMGVRPRREVAGLLGAEDFSRMDQVIAAVASRLPDQAEVARRALARYRPCLVANRIQGRSLNTRLIREMMRGYVGADLAFLGEIPEDEAVGRSFRTLEPLLLALPDSPAARALDRLADLALAAAPP